MNNNLIPTWYYRQFDADYSLDVPAKGYGGWIREMLPLESSRTALAVMHAWDCGKKSDYPGWYRAVEYIERANKISENVFPELLGKVRSKGMNVIHIADDSGYADGMEGHEMALELSNKYYKNKPVVFDMITSEVYEYLNEFRKNHSFPGIDNIEDIAKGRSHKSFMKNAVPLPKEFIVTDSSQLHSICMELGINHLIYIGFAINWCLQYSPGNMNDMTAKGIICSTIKEAVTAVENKESAEYECHKEYALWLTALKNGFVYELDDFMRFLDSI